MLPGLRIRLLLQQGDAAGSDCPQHAATQHHTVSEGVLSCNRVVLCVSSTARTDLLLLLLLLCLQHLLQTGPDLQQRREYVVHN
jgi:hypothetical protein